MCVVALGDLIGEEVGAGDIVWDKFTEYVGLLGVVLIRHILFNLYYATWLVQLMINYINKMEIDFNALSFKISKPSKLTPECLLLEDTKASHIEEETANPFRRTSKLFKNSNKSHSPQPSCL